jgi:hypothetical protein
MEKMTMYLINNWKNIEQNNSARFHILQHNILNTPFTAQKCQHVVIMFFI